jgi:hypothetical protein
MDGVNAYIWLLRHEGNLDGQRLAAKTLVNLTKAHPNVRQDVVRVLEPEIGQMYRHDIDGIIATYLQTLVHPS